MFRKATAERTYDSGWTRPMWAPRAILDWRMS